MNKKRSLSEPLRVCQSCEGVQHLLGLIGRFGVMLALTIAVLLIPTLEALSLEGHRTQREELPPTWLQDLVYDQEKYVEQAKGIKVFNTYKKPAFSD